MNGLSAVSDCGQEFRGYLLELQCLLDFLNQLLHIVLFKQPTEDLDGELEPRLLIYDGHLSHMQYGAIDLARQKKLQL